MWSTKRFHSLVYGLSFYKVLNERNLMKFLKRPPRYGLERHLRIWSRRPPPNVASKAASICLQKVPRYGLEEVSRYGLERRLDMASRSRLRILPPETLQYALESSLDIPSKGAPIWPREAASEYGPGKAPRYGLKKAASNLALRRLSRPYRGAFQLS